MALMTDDVYVDKITVEGVAVMGGTAGGDKIIVPAIRFEFSSTAENAPKIPIYTFLFEDTNAAKALPGLLAHAASTAIKQARAARADQDHQRADRDENK